MPVAKPTASVSLPQCRQPAAHLWRDKAARSAGSTTSISREVRASCVPASLRFRHDAGRPMNSLLTSLFRRTIPCLVQKIRCSVRSRELVARPRNCWVNRRPTAAKWGKTLLHSLLNSLLPGNCQIRVLDWPSHGNGGVTMKRAAKHKAKIDWSRADAMTEAERHAAAMADPDARPMTDEEWAQAPRVPVVGSAPKCP